MSARTTSTTSCGITDVGDCVGDAIVWAAESIFEMVVEWLGQAALAIIKLVITGWLDIDTPLVGEDATAVPILIAYLQPITYVVMVLAMMAAGARLAWNQRGEDFRELATAIVKYVVLVGLGATLVHTLTKAGDEYSTWILGLTTEGVAGESLQERMEKVILPAGAAGALAPGVMFFMFILMIISGLIQVVMVYVRFAVLVLLTVTLPIAAAAALTREGRPMLNKYVTWGAAWILWKPVAATVYAVGFALIAQGGTGVEVITGIATLAMAVFALPALMRLIAPVTAATGSGGVSGAAAATGVLAAGSLMRGKGGSGSGGAATSRMRVRNATNSNGPSGARAARSGWRAGKAGKVAAAAKAATVSKAALAAGVVVAGAMAEGAKRGAESATGEGK